MKKIKLVLWQALKGLGILLGMTSETPPKSVKAFSSDSKGMRNALMTIQGKPSLQNQADLNGHLDFCASVYQSKAKDNVVCLSTYRKVKNAAKGSSQKQAE